MPKSILEPVLPTLKDASQAAKAFRTFSNGELKVADLPDIVVKMFKTILNQTAQGQAITVVSVESDMTTTEAAKYLNVSRPYFVKLLDNGSIAFHRVGAHKRIAFKDLEKYKDAQREKSYLALAELQAEAQELKMGY
jgi:excisionase family DNA binding protein